MKFPNIVRKHVELISIFRTPVIEFLCDARYIDVAPPPFPAGQGMPEWYKRIPPVSKLNRDQHGRKALSAKKCIPMIDAMTLGFIIPLAMDQQVNSNHDCSIVKIGPTSTEFDKMVEFHGVDQVGGKSPIFKSDPIKFINPWVIKTAPGWSSLFTPCINHLEDRFVCLSGMVDTDKYPKQVNFPGVWLKPNFDDYLPAGTPLVTVIPFKRTDIITKYNVREISTDENKVIDTIRKCQTTRLGYYANELKDRK